MKLIKSSMWLDDTKYYIPNIFKLINKYFFNALSECHIKERSFIWYKAGSKQRFQYENTQEVNIDNMCEDWNNKWYILKTWFSKYRLYTCNISCYIQKKDALTLIKKLDLYTYTNSEGDEEIYKRRNK